MAITKAVIIFAFILECDLPYSTGRPRFKAVLQSDMAPRGQLRTEPPLPDQFSFISSEDNSVLLPALQQLHTLPNIGPRTPGVGFSSKLSEAEEVPQSYPRGQHQYSGDASAIETSEFQAINRIANFLLSDEQLSANETSLQELHQISQAEASSRKRPAEHGSGWNFPFMHDQGHGHHPKKIPIVNTEENTWLEIWATSFPEAEASLAHQIPDLNPYIETRYQEPLQASLEQVPSLMWPVTSALHNWKNAGGQHFPILNEHRNLEQDHQFQHSSEDTSQTPSGALVTSWGHVCNPAYCYMNHPLVAPSRFYTETDQNELIMENETRTSKSIKFNLHAEDIILHDMTERENTRDSNSQLPPTSPKNEENTLKDTSVSPSKDMERVKITPINHTRFPEIQAADDHTFNFENETHLYQFRKTTGSSSELINRKIIAWISSSTDILSVTEEVHMRAARDEFIEAVNQTQNEGIGCGLLKDIFMGKMNDEIKITIRRLENLVKHSWCLNLNFLKAFQIKQSDPKMQIEQRIMFRWLLDTIILNKIDQNLASNSDTDLHEVLSQQIDGIRFSIFSYLKCEDEGDLWEISYDKSGFEVDDIRTPRFKMTEVAIELIKLYYKSINNGKWKYIFPSENIFFWFLACINKPNLNNYWNNHLILLIIQKLDHDPVLPWNSVFTSKSQNKILSHESFFQLGENEALKRMTQSQIRLIELNPKNSGSESEFRTGQHDPRVYVWISSMAKKNLRIEVSQIENLWDIFSQKLKTLEENLYDDGIHISNMRELIKEFWFINYRILEGFGAEYSSAEFQNELNCIQEWLLDFIVVAYENCNTEPNSCEVLWKRITHFTIFENDSSVWTCPCSGKKRSNEGGRALKDIKGSRVRITISAINLVGSYYKTKNPHKWHCVYQHDGMLLTMLVKIANRVYRRNIGDNRFWNKTRLSGIHVLPWKCDLKLGSMTLKEFRLKYFGERSKHSPEKLISSGLLGSITHKVIPSTGNEIMFIQN